MPLNTYGHSLGPAADVYEDVYFISPVTDMRAPHVIFFLLFSESLSLRFSLHPERQAAASPLSGLARAPRPPTTDHLRFHTLHRWHRSDTTRPRPLLLVVDPCPHRHCRALPSAAAAMAAPGSSSSISPETPPFTSPLHPLASQGDDASKQQLFGINPRLEHLLPSSQNLAAVAKFRSAQQQP